MQNRIYKKFLQHNKLTSRSISNSDQQSVDVERLQIELKNEKLKNKRMVNEIALAKKIIENKISDEALVEAVITRSFSQEQMKKLEYLAPLVIRSIFVMFARINENSANDSSRELHVNLCPPKKNKE